MGHRQMNYRAEPASAADLAIGVHLAISLERKLLNSSGDIRRDRALSAPSQMMR